MREGLGVRETPKPRRNFTDFHEQRVKTGDDRALVLFKSKTKPKPAHSFVTFYILMIALCLDHVWTQLLGLTRF